MKKYIFILFAFLMVTHLQAQSTHYDGRAERGVSITAKEERAIYEKVYELIQNYATNAAVSDKGEEKYFRNLFASDTLQIGNDLMSLSHKESLSVNEYISLLKDAKSVKVVIKNLRKFGDIKETDKAWTLRVGFEKSISFSKCNTYFDSEKYFKEPYRFVADLSIDKHDGKCKFYRLALDPEQNPPLIFPDKYSVLVRTDQDENERNYRRDDKLTIDGEFTKDLWSREQIILHENQKIRYNNGIVEVDTIETDECGGYKIRADYEDRSFRVRANVGHSLMGFNMLDGAKPDIVSKDGETSLGLDVGYIIPSDGKFFAGIYAGVGLSKNDLSITMKPEGDVYIPSEADEDGDSYIRHYKVEGEGITQRFSAMELALPLYADFEYRFSPVLSVYANMGARFQFTEDTWEAQISKYTTFGQYESAAYGSLMIDGSVNLNGFGTYDGPSAIEVDRSGMTSRTSICALMGLGLRADINKQIAVDVGMQYLMGGYSWKKADESAQLFSYVLPDGWEGMTKEQKAQGDRVNLLSQINGIKRNAFRLTLGLIFKF